MSLRGKIKQYLLVLESLKRKPASKSELISKLKNQGFSVSARTFDRLIESLRDEFDVEIEYNRINNFYQLAEVLTLEKINQLIRILESSQAADFIQSLIKDPKNALRYISVESSELLKGINQLPIIYEAIKQHQVMEFSHTSFTTGLTKEHRVKPYMLKEYLYRWYLVGTYINENEPRVFGIDRITNLQISSQNFIPDSLFAYHQLFEHIIGLDFSADNVEEVQLEFSAQQAKYLKSFPIHPSQKIITESTNGVIIQVSVMINYELIQQILQWGNNVKVLAPFSLRNTIHEMIKKIVEKY